MFATHHCGRGKIEFAEAKSRAGTQPCLLILGADPPSHVKSIAFLTVSARFPDGSAASWHGSGPVSGLGQPFYHSTAKRVDPSTGDFSDGGWTKLTYGDKHLDSAIKARSLGPMFFREQSVAWFTGKSTLENVVLTSK